MCERMQYSGVSFGFLCGRGQPRPKLCFICGRRPATRLCDFPVTTRRTCDKPLCATCSVSPGCAAELDYCPTHEAVPIVDLFEGLQ